MAFPDIYSPNEPQASETVASGPSKLVTNFTALGDFLGIPSTPTQLTAPAFSMTSAGVVTIVQANPLVAGNPTVALGIAPKQYVDAAVGGVTAGLGSYYGTASGTNAYTVTLANPSAGNPPSLASIVGADDHRRVY